MSLKSVQDNRNDLIKRFEDAQALLCKDRPSTREIWYKTRRTDLSSLSGNLESIVIHQFQGSMSLALTTLFPEHAWEPWKFNRVPPNFWDDPKSRKQFLESFAEFQSIKVWPDDWYSVSLEAVRNYGGHQLLSKYYQDSLIAALQDLYPQYDWEVWRFGKVPSNFWQDVDNQKRFWTLLGKKKGFKSFDDWYNISYEDIVQNGGATILKNYHSNSIAKALTAVYPEHTWDNWKFPVSAT